MTKITKMNRKKWGFLVALSLFGAATTSPARAQVVTQNANGLFTNQSGGAFHSESGAQMDQMIQNNMAMSNAMTQIYLNDLARRQSPNSPEQLQLKRGQRLIRAGRATLAFTMRPAPIEKWLDAWQKTYATGRRGAYTEWVGQSTLWRQEAQARGAKFGDMADMLALAFVLSAEGYSGKRVNNAGLARMSRDFRRVYLKDANYQGYSTLKKQETYEAAMLTGSWALYQRREGVRRGDPKMIEIARKTGGEFLDGHWSGDSKTARDADEAIVMLARFSTAAPPPARVAIRPIAPKPRAILSPRVAVAQSPARDDAKPVTPQLTFAQAEREALFSPTEVVLPTLLSAKESGERREKARAGYAQIIAAGRQRMRGIFSAPAGKENAADAMTFAILSIYTTMKTSSGNISEAGFTPKNLTGLNRQITLMLGNDAKFRARSDREKQIDFERAILMGTLIGALNGEADRTGEAADQKRARETARRALKQLLGVEPDRIRLTDEGLAF